MPTTTVVDGNIYVTTGSVSGNDITYSSASQVVLIHSTSPRYKYSNQLRIRPIAESKPDRTKEPITQIIDLKKITEILTVRGWLADESGETAKTKMNNLINMGKTGGELTMVWGTTTAGEQILWKPDADKRQHGVFIQDIDITESAGSVGETVDTSADNNPPERKLAIILTLVRGKDI